MTKRLLTILVTALLLFAFSGEALADDKARAQELLSEGNALLQQGDNGGALAKFEAAYVAYPSPSLLLNIGTTLRALGRNAEAANAYARWVRAKQNPERLAEVEEVLTELDRKVAGITLDLSITGAAVTIDGKPVAKELMADLIRLEPGPHVIVAKRAGYQDLTKRVDLTVGQKETVKLDLVATGGVANATGGGESSGDDDDDDTMTSASMSDTPEPNAGRGLRFAGLGVAGVGLLSVAAAVKFGLDAKSLNDELDGKDSGAWTDADLAKQKDGESAQTKMIIFGAVGGAAIVAGATLYFIGRSQGKSAENSMAVAPVVTDTTVGWALSGTF